MSWFLAYVATGAIVGVLAGMLGIGGGATLVPILSALFAAQNLAPGHVVHLALGTAMATIVFTSASSAREHYRLGGVDLHIVRRLGAGMMVGALFSTLASAWIAQRNLAIAFAVIVYLSATQILLNKKPAASRPLPHGRVLFGAGLAIGVISGLISAGGAFLSVPFMLWCGVPMRTTIGTAAMCGIPLAVLGSVGYLIAGWNTPQLPSDAFGFISVFALSGLVCGSVVTAPFGARIAHRLPVLALKRIFACLLYVLATRMLLAYA